MAPKNQPKKVRRKKRSTRIPIAPTLTSNEGPDKKPGFRYLPIPEPPEWFDTWLRPIFDHWYEELGRAVKVHCHETADYYIGYRYAVELDPVTMTLEELEKRELCIHWPKQSWKPILGPRSDIPSPTILDIVDIPESKPFPPEPLPGSVADQRLQATKPESTAAERIAEKAKRAKERAERKKRYFSNF